METVLRHWNLLRLIPRPPRKITSEAVTAQLKNIGFKTTLRTVQRDLNSLSQYFPITCDDKRPAGWNWEQSSPSFDVPCLDPHAALTFLLARHFLQPMLPPECLNALDPHFRRAEKILEEIPGGFGTWADKVEIVSRCQPLLPPVISEGIMNTVCDALLREIRLTLRYRRRGESETREYQASPLGLVFSDQIIYLVCTLFDYQDPKLLALHRIETANILDQGIDPLADFDLHQFVHSGTFGFLLSDRQITIQLRFTDFVTASHLLETPLAEDQKVHHDKDGSVLVEATVPDTARLRWWILGFGEQVEVLEPKELRAEIGEKCWKAALLYQCDG